MSAARRSPPTGRSGSFSRLAKLHVAVHATDSYGLLLALLLVDYCLLSLVDTTRWFGLAVGVPLSLSLLLALRTSRARHRGVQFGRLGVAVTLVAGLVTALAGGREANAAVILMVSMLLLVTPYVILRRILSHPSVNGETILGAICVYVVIGIFFAVLFYGISRVSSPADPFLAQPPPDHPPSDYLYLSFITLTTVGFGDLTPHSGLARSVVPLEALIGQIFLVTLVARLVSLFGMDPRSTKAQQRQGARRPDGDPGVPGGAERDGGRAQD